MAKKMVSVRDKKTECFGTPVLVSSISEAERMFEDMVNQTNTVFSNHPGDFDLYCIGSFDETSGLIVPESFLVGNGDSYKH